MRAARILPVASLLLLGAGVGSAQALYKYLGPDGEWVYTDRAPETADGAEVRQLATGGKKPAASVAHRLADRQIQIYATNGFYAPVEVVLALDELENVELPPPEASLRWVLPARSQAELLHLAVLDGPGAPSVRYRYLYIAGDPEAEPNADRPYRAPFATAKRFTVSQAFPVGVTHTTPDSFHAVDIAMPVGTDIYAARGGTVFEVASTNFRAGADPAAEGASANLIRIVHDDGTIAVYAHLNWNSIRVRPGDRVQQGDYIAESGNTGFSSGPHLHFAVLRNRGLRHESLPVVFQGPSGAAVTPETGLELVAY